MSGGKLERANGEREAHYVRLARHLRNRLGDGLSADGRLPSYRTLADEFSVSIGVVQRAMELLRQESLVQIHHGKSGRIVPGKSVQPEIAKYGMIHPYTPGNDFERNLIAIASDVFDRECNHAVPIVRSSNGSSARERELAETMVYNGVRGMLLSPENESANANYFQELARRIPVMLIDQPLGDADLPLVMFDYAAAGEEIGRKIRRSGRRRTLLLLNEKTNSSIEALTANMSEHVTTFAFRTPLFRMAARVKQRDFALFDTIRERLLKELEACEADSVFSPFDILLDHLEEECAKVMVATDDGSLGYHGFVDALVRQELSEDKNYDAVLACGPKPMLRNVAKAAQEFGVPCQVSMEERMGCGVGACLVCACDMKDGTRKHVCKDGPVFDSKEVDWDA